MNPADTPMSYLVTAGPAADPVTRLNWGLIAVSLAVVAIIAALLLGAVLRRRPHRPGFGAVERTSANSGLRWIYIGTGISSVVLAACAIWTLLALSAVTRPAVAPAFTVRVTGLQWWWRLRYEGAEAGGNAAFLTANELHIPVGKPVRLELEGGDVIHSFWVPRLGGKTDTIPGLTNVSWIQADRPGVYRGQCGEYCGAQHAHMAMQVVAEPEPAFRAWWQAQLAAAAPAAPGPALPGARLVQQHCAVCHAIRGTDADGLLGPDLTHLMSRRTIAAGTLPNDPAHLARWIAHPQQVKPEARMPAVVLSDSELRDVVAYLTTLR
ncbi:cytochrome c oxidase subunit II [Massilia sp. UMI-21]|nr:cytochrome c oxidase subunit II [Massilia sp. UMI-21]